MIAVTIRTRSALWVPSRDEESPSTPQQRVTQTLSEALPEVIARTLNELFPAASPNGTVWEAAQVDKPICNSVHPLSLAGSDLQVDINIPGVRRPLDYQAQAVIAALHAALVAALRAAGVDETISPTIGISLVLQDGSIGRCFAGDGDPLNRAAA